MGIREDDRHQATLQRTCMAEPGAGGQPQPRSGRQAVRGFQGPTWGCELQKTTGLINDCKVVVCLDSLYRVVTRNFDTVVVDEAVAVFLHFNS
jgi:hypothetical protein